MAIRPQLKSGVLLLAALAGIISLVFALGVRRGSEHDALVIWRKSLAEGEATPMRAEMTMTQRRHGITYKTQAHVVQGAGGRYRMEYLLPQDARGRIVFSDGTTVWQYEPNQNRLAKTTMAPITTRESGDEEPLVESNYKIALSADNGSAAGRPAYVLDLLPKHAGKSSQRRWIDKRTLKTLRIETHYTDGILASMISYDQVALPAVVTEADFAPMDTRTIRTVSAPGILDRVPANGLIRRAGELGLKPGADLGFRLMQISSSEIDHAPATQLLYSDGIETVSIFVQAGNSKALIAPANWQKLQIAGIPVFENLDGHLDALVWIRNGRRYTGVSHLTPQALQTVIESELR